MTRLTLAEIARAIKAADQAGKVAVMVKGGIIFAERGQIALPSPEPERGNSCDGIWGTGSSP
jgi:hypothetical protein